MEQWKNIIGFEGYQVSDLGRVRSLRFGKERVLSACKDKNGYLLVVLCKGGKRKTCRVHRLVAEAFIPNPYGLPEVNHIDEDKQSNVVSNLEWCDSKYNCNYGTRTERTTKALNKAVYQYTHDGSLVRSYPSVMEAERSTGCNHGYISKCCSGKYKQAYGYIWSYTPINNQRINLF